MGYESVELRVFARLSRHNSERDDADDQTWAAFTAVVREVASRPEFADIEIDFY